MRTTTLMLAAVLAGLAPVAWAQSRPETMSQAAAPGAVPASDLQSYARLLQDAETRLRQAQQAAARAPVQRQEGAVSGERIELMRTARAAQDTVQQVPTSFAGTEAYRNADRELRETLSGFVSAQREGGQGSMQAADRAVGILAGLRQQVMQAAGASGGSVPTPSTGGSGR
ncbi:hypothetical protein [Belnapia rosea]|uniref:DUF4168 domain-containing protein n=1 Tax=Belnapia rosea TaxID=938405 RepID=A0A1G7CA59_9PROT|nr:hypothetical protein [Belnapia rosea]SDE36191.1 hypothetical protein SAMN04487779_103026 [Belnapia rosea]